MFKKRAESDRTEKYREAIREDVEEKIAAVTSWRDSLRGIMDEMKARS